MCECEGNVITILALKYTTFFVTIVRIIILHEEYSNDFCILLGINMNISSVVPLRLFSSTFETGIWTGVEVGHTLSVASFLSLTRANQIPEIY